MQNSLPNPKNWEVDVVYIWCDSNHPEYIKNRKKYSKEYNLNSYWSPTRDHGEIFHSIQSVRKNMPWVRDIIICSPKWHRVKNLDEKKYGVRYVDNQVILWEENCPNFNSHSLELFTYKIPWISEYFIQFNDDFFINAEVSLEDFYNFKTQKVKYYYEDILLLWKALSPVTQDHIKKLWGEKYYFWTTHSPRMFCRGDIRKIIELYSKSTSHTQKSKFRNKSDFQLVHFYGYYLLSKNRWEFVFLKNNLHQNKLLFSFKILIWKLFQEGIITTLRQIYLQMIYKKRLLKNKIFSDKEIYSLIHIWNDYKKNKQNIDFALEKRIPFICLNDSYTTKDQKTIEKIHEENYNYFYKKLLG